MKTDMKTGNPNIADAIEQAGQVFEYDQTASDNLADRPYWTSFPDENAKVLAAVARHKGDTSRTDDPFNKMPGQVAYENACKDFMPSSFSELLPNQRDMWAELESAVIAYFVKSVSSANQRLCCSRDSSVGSGTPLNELKNLWRIDMNKPHETHPTVANLEARIAELEAAPDQHTSFAQENAKVLAAVARPKCLTPKQIALAIVEAFVAKAERVLPDGSTCEDFERDLEIPIAKAIAEARAVAIEEAKNVVAATYNYAFSQQIMPNYENIVAGISDLAILPPSLACVPVKLSDQEAMAINGLLWHADYPVESVVYAKEFWKQIIEALTARTK
jgi:hypothetical protein